MKCSRTQAVFLLMTLQANAFVMKDGFSDLLHHPFSNLTQYKNQLESVQKTLALKNAMTSLLVFIAPYLEAEPDFKHPFKTNCSVAFDSKVKQVACDTQFKDVQAPTSSCKSEQQLTDNDLIQLHKSHLFQMHTTVGLGPVRHPQVTYWWYSKLPPTPTASLSRTDTRDESPTHSQSNAHSLTSTLTPSKSHPSTVAVSTSITETTGNRSHTTSQSTSPSQVSSCDSLDSYADSTNQTGRYLVSGDAPNSTVTDLWTGLMWDQQTCGSANFSQALACCSNLAKQGHTDWRLPTVQELQSLVDYSLFSPAINKVFSESPDRYLWSSVSVAGSFQGRVWSVRPGYEGFGYCSDRANINTARCVRTKASEPQQYLNGNDHRLSTVDTFARDRSVGFMWQRNYLSTSVDVSDARDYCRNLILNGGRWRLPTLKELSTITDLQTAEPSINTTVFPNTLGNKFLTSTSFAPNTSYVWAANLYFDGDQCSGGFTPVLANANFWVRCVRDPQWSTRAYEDSTNQPDRYYTIGDGADAVVKDTYTNLMWEQQGPPESMTWENASSYCAGLVKQNYGCWRLPTPQELQSIVDYTVSGSNATIQSLMSPYTLTGSYWTSSLYTPNPSAYWRVEFNQGDIDAHQATSPAYVRCVRGKPTSAAVPFTDEHGSALNGTSTQVKDRTTGLIWQRRQASNYLNWDSLVSRESAQWYCNNLVIKDDGAGSWRLPTLKELVSIVDYDLDVPAINTSVLLGTASNGYWTSSVNPKQSNKPRDVSFHHGATTLNVPSNKYNVRCILNTSAPANNGRWSPFAFEDATNQTARYYVSGTTPNAIVTDDFTGLMWEQQVSPSTYFWNASAPAGSAQAYCASLTKGGYTDWRLPTTVEKQSLVDYSVQPVTDAMAFSDRIPTQNFWLSEQHATNSSNAWYAAGSGQFVFGSIDTTLRVRCVRGNKQNSFSAYADGEGGPVSQTSSQILDTSTNLIWQRSMGFGLFWNSNMQTGSAQWYCNNLVIRDRGAGCWRVPTIKELATLMDTQSTVNINVSAFLFSHLAWAFSSTSNFVPGFGYTVKLGSTGYVNAGQVGSGSVRCILNTSATANNGMWSPLAYQDATNQTARYYVSGISPDAIVKDDFTGLIWEQEVSPSTYFWNASAPAGSAQAYCAGLTKGGYTDWRLPNLFELQSLVDYSVGSAGPTIKATIFPGSPTGDFWTSNPYPKSVGDSIYLRFSFGDSSNKPSNSMESVRCVRGLQLASASYTDADGNSVSLTSNLVRSLTTRLTWQRKLSANPLFWDNSSRTIGSAGWYCHNLVLDNIGAGSWRLPTVKELTSLIELSDGTIGLNAAVFPNGVDNVFWASIPLTGYTGIDWYVHPANAAFHFETYTDPFYARCVLDTSAPANNERWSPIAYEDATNQTARYYVSGNSPNGIVTDDFTGLMWEQEVSPSTYFWNASAPAGSAQAYCASLTKGGYSDWRLPTPQEFQSLVGYTGSSINSAAVDSNAFGSNTPSARYWTDALSTATGVFDVRLTERGIILDDGVVGTTSYNTWCVRGGTKPLEIRYNIIDNVQIEDILTGLQWQRNQASESLLWNASAPDGTAQWYCKNLVIGGHGFESWRLPTLKELTTLVDYRLANAPRINSTVFSSVSGIYWSSTKVPGEPAAWIVGSIGGIDHSYNNIMGNQAVRCILNTSATANNGMWSPLAYQGATNQTARYYVSGSSPSGIVTDDFTGLMWEQNTSAVKYSWNVLAAPGSAQAYCASLTKGGYTDWRLPSLLEMHTLSDYTVSNPSPSINLTAFPNSLNGRYWTSTIWGNDPAVSAMTLEFGNGAPYSYGMIQNCSVRCVRGWQSAITDNRYTDENDQLLVGGSAQVKDQHTGLIWQRGQSSSALNWNPSATAGTGQFYCQNLAIGSDGVGTWRLPNAKELWTLVVNSTNPSINLTAFPGTLSDLYWTTTEVAGSPGAAWQVNFATGSPWSSYGGANFWLRCVRGP